MRKAILATVAALAGAAVLAAAGVATPGSEVTATTLARGLATEKVKTRGNQPFDVVTQKLVIAPGGQTGWHTHPGMAVATVTTGELTIYEGDDRSCSPHAYGVGDTYVDAGYGHVHIGRNEGAVPLEIVVTYLDVPAGGGSARIDAPDPGSCSF